MASKLTPLTGLELLERYASGERDFNHHYMERADLRGARLSNIQLRGCSFLELRCEGAIFRNADLRDAQMRGAKAAGADFLEAKLNRTNLRCALLTSANFERASLYDVNFVLADLCDANLSSTRLRFANLGSARLARADLTNAEMGRTILADVDLSELNSDLAAIDHASPSRIDAATLRRSGGRVPASFLQGCGFQDWEIEAAKLYDSRLSVGEVHDIQYRVSDLRAGQPIQFFSVFISYSHADRDFARQLHDILQSAGIRCWLDEKQLLPGDDIHERIDHGIQVWDKVLLCASRASLTSWWVDNEIERAFEKERRLMTERSRKVLALIPLNLDGFLFEGWTSGKATQVRSRLAGNFLGWNENGFQMGKAMEPLLRALRADDSGREPLPHRKL